MLYLQALMARLSEKHAVVTTTLTSLYSFSRRGSLGSASLLNLTWQQRPRKRKIPYLPEGAERFPETSSSGEPASRSSS